MGVHHHGKVWPRRKWSAERRERLKAAPWLFTRVGTGGREDSGRYRGGAVEAHASTNDLGNPDLPKKHPMQFGQPGASANKALGRGRPRDKERQCLEAIQNGKTAKELKDRFPAKMVARLSALYDAASDNSHRDFINANRLVTQILTRHQGDHPDELEARPAGDTITVIEGRIEVPMPGMEKEANAS